MVGRIIAVCTSEKKQTKKINVGDACLKEHPIPFTIIQLVLWQLKS
ncbi:hypothetical protein [Methanobacterium sp. MBAC-LM]